MSGFKRAVVVRGQPLRKDPLASLRLASMVDTRPVLPAEIIALIVEHLAIPDLLRFARVSKRMQEMVYDDTRWVQRLRRMGCWDELEARQAVDVPVLDHEDSTIRSSRQRKSTNPGKKISGTDKSPPSPRLVDLSQPAANGLPKETGKISHRDQRESSDGFYPVSVASPTSTDLRPARQEDAGLDVLGHVRSIRGQARQEYGKVYQVLTPFYNDVVSAERPMSCKVFSVYGSPDQQAQMLSQLSRFARGDLAVGAALRRERLEEVASIFDTAALLEFRKGYEEHDIRGRMRKYAHVLHTLNGGQSSIDLFTQHNPLILNKERLGAPGDCIEYAAGHGDVSFEQVQRFFDRLHAAYAEQHAAIEHAFPVTSLVVSHLVVQIGEKVLRPYLTALFDEAHDCGIFSYLNTVSGTVVQTQNVFLGIQHPEGLSDGYRTLIGKLVKDVYEPHLDLYLAEELDYFNQTAQAEIDQWDQALSEQATSTETFLMSNVNRRADKKDFMSSFKKVVMMPVNILPSFPTMSSNKSTAKALVDGGNENGEKIEGRGSSPSRSVDRMPANPVQAVTPLRLEAPTTELAAKAAIMTSKLETIRSLFSLEVALSLVQRAKASLERVAQFNQLDGAPGQASKRQCSAIYVSLLYLLGTGHVKAGFDKAVDHLSNYKPRQADGDRGSTKTKPSRGVAPLTTFIELVNVGDLIQQMLDVFFESELIRLGIAHRDDFLDPAVKEKKRFEQMLDERVAAGLAKGIDVLMDEVEYIFATTQSPHDFNPSTTHLVTSATATPPSASSSLSLPPAASASTLDIGPTATSKQIIDLVSTHTSLLTGSTDKALLDVFSNEVGLRLFTCLTKHLKRHRISTAGALPLLSDLSAYSSFIATTPPFRNNADLLSCFTALREIGQLYLIEVDVGPGPSAGPGVGASVGATSRSSTNTTTNTAPLNQRSRGRGANANDGAKEMATIIADSDRYRGIFSVDEVLEFVERRADWLTVRTGVEAALYGKACLVM